MPTEKDQSKDSSGTQFTDDQRVQQDTSIPSIPSMSSIADGSIGDFTEQWPNKIIEVVDLAVSTINQRAVNPIIQLVSWLVFGAILFLLVSAIGILVTLALVRFSTIYLFDNNVWITYLVIGGLLSIAGLVAHRRAVHHRPATNKGA